MKSVNLTSSEAQVYEVTGISRFQVCSAHSPHTATYHRSPGYRVTRLSSLKRCSPMSQQLIAHISL